MRVKRLNKVTVYRSVNDLVIATVYQYKGERKSRFKELTSDLEIVPQLGFTQKGFRFAVAGAGSSHLTSMNVAFALETR